MSNLPVDYNLPTDPGKETWLCNERLLTWDIKPNDVVIIIGGYQGYVCGEFLKRYPECKLYTFEPQSIMMPNLLKVVDGKGKAFNYGLGVQDGFFEMVSPGNDACSFILKHTTASTIIAEMREFSSVMRELGIDEIAHFHCNIEGYEYLLIPHLIKTGWIKKIGQMAIATHPIPGVNIDSKLWENIENNLSKTHFFYWRQRGIFAWSRPDKFCVDLLAGL